MSQLTRRNNSEDIEGNIKVKPKKSGKESQFMVLHVVERSSYTNGFPLKRQPTGANTTLDSDILGAVKYQSAVSTPSEQNEL